MIPEWLILYWVTIVYMQIDMIIADALKMMDAEDGKIVKE